ncbi:hypothetical protein NST23_22105 [Brevibacillus sp. FSL K6-0770]|uniref:hypothetical protein n=1 Tax=Brevibacillus TaxID=55080 RepID=UPI000EBC6F26|nr:hypothetical protein [Brevibacillus sp.]HBZ82271.1 hypothetical protein [Brevibacillus sp.]
MKRLLLALFTLVIMTVMPFSAFAVEEEIISTPGQFNLIQQPLEGVPQAKAGGIGGFGTIKCYPELVGPGLAYCNWTLDISKSGDVISGFSVYITINDSNGKLVHQEPIAKKLTGTLYSKYHDQIDFQGLSPGTYTATVHGTVAGVSSGFVIAPVKSASFKIPL